jgi:drug/metabolite transporter (DMT)-like permease
MYILIFLQQLIASLTHVLAKNLTEFVHPELVLFYRSLLAALIVTGWIFYKRNHIRKIEKRDIPVLLILSIINIPINQFLFITAIHLTTAPNAALAYALSPAFVLIIAIIFLKENAGILKISGVIIAFAGAFLIFFERGLQLNTDTFLGNILVLIASFSWALYTVIGRNFSRKYGAIYSTSLSMILGFLFYIPIFLLLPVPFHFIEIKIISWLQIFYLGIFSSVVGYVLWYYALKKIEASRVAVFNNLQAVLTTILAVIFLSQIITIFFVIGGVLIITGVIMAQWRSNKI